MFKYFFKNDLKTFGKSIGILQTFAINKPQTKIIKIQLSTFADKSSKIWLDRQKNDPFVKKSKILEYRSRGAFKLIEINQKYKLLRPGTKVLDVGSAPGGWSQIIADNIKSDIKKPQVVAVDINHMDPLNGVIFLQGNFNDKKVQDNLIELNNYEKFDLVCSDICPEFTGEKFVDHTRLIELNQVTKNFAFKVLKRNGNLVIKTFEGTMQKKFSEGIKNYFNKIHRFKPTSSRSESSELYLVCLGYLENEELKKEAEEIMKMQPSDYLEKRKEEALKEYKMNKLNRQFPLEELDKMREEIMKKYKLDPDKIKIDEKEAEEIRKMLDDERKRFRREYFGRAYSSEAKNLTELYAEYKKDMKEYDEKLKEVLKNEKIDLTEVEEFFRVDSDMQHMEEITNANLKEAEFYEKQMDILEKKISEEEAKEMLKPDFSENEILKKYKKWSDILDEETSKLDDNFEQNKADDREKMHQGFVNTHGKEDEQLQNLKKKLRKTIKKQDQSTREDIFWAKKNANKNNEEDK